MATVHPGTVPSMMNNTKTRKDDIILHLNNPPSDGFEGKLYEAGLGNKPVVPEVLQDAARTIVYRYVGMGVNRLAQGLTHSLLFSCCDRNPANRPLTKALSSLLGKVQSQNKLTRRWTDRYR